MKKGVSFVWDTKCQKAFEDIKQYLTNPQALAALVSGKPFLRYVRAMDHASRALLAQTNDKEHKQAICYLIRTMISTKHRYNPIKKSV